MSLKEKISNKLMNIVEIFITWINNNFEYLKWLMIPLIILINFIIWGGLITGVVCLVVFLLRMLGVL